MDIAPLATTRVGLRQRGSNMIDNINVQRNELEKINQQLASGRRLEVPSDRPADAAVAINAIALTVSTGLAIALLRQARRNPVAV